MKRLEKLLKLRFYRKMLPADAEAMPCTEGKENERRKREAGTHRRARAAQRFPLAPKPVSVRNEKNTEKVQEKKEKEGKEQGREGSRQSAEGLRARVSQRCRTTSLTLHLLHDPPQRRGYLGRGQARLLPHRLVFYHFSGQARQHRGSIGDYPPPGDILRRYPPARGRGSPLPSSPHSRVVPPRLLRKSSAHHDSGEGIRLPPPTAPAAPPAPPTIPAPRTNISNAAEAVSGLRLQALSCLQ